MISISAFTQYSPENDVISTGRIEPVYFLGAVLFIILIMIALLFIKILNMKSRNEQINKNEKV